MFGKSRWQLSFFVLVLVLLSMTAVSQRAAWPARGAHAVPKPAPVVTRAPVPPALLAGKKIFLSNAGADSGLFPSPFTGPQDRAYNQFYTALKDWGRYDVVSNPVDADLVFELQVMNVPGNYAEFRLVIFDRQTHYVLWALAESVEFGNLQKTRDRNFDEALTALLSNLKSVVTPAPAPVP